ncbi:hypothetical protein V8E51_011828 [Hyaloscypha variabilis]
MTTSQGAKKAQGRVALVTGGNGITGNAIIEYLATTTTTNDWSKIIVTSNSPLESKIKDPRIIFIALDFTQDSRTLIEQMQPVCTQTTHTYFSSYIHKDDFRELNHANEKLFENFLQAITTVAPNLENVTLQTGGKYYNIHIQPAPNPLREDYPRAFPKSQNFYYGQEDFLKEYQKGKNWSWNVIRPQAIIGSTYKPNGMNSALTFALYFSICKELGTKAPMPTNRRFWEGYDDVSYAPLIADLTIFVSTRLSCANEAFNCTNGDVICWKYLWPQLAAYFGIDPADADVSAQINKVEEPLEGTAEQFFSLNTWAKDKRPVWDKLCEETKTANSKKTFDCGTWQFQDWVFQRTWSALLSVSKARRYGWTGYIDSLDSFIATFDELAKQGVIPKRDVMLIIFHF